MELKYQDEISISRKQLDNEWAKQPVLCLKYGDLYAEAVAERDHLKRQMDVVRAQVDEKVRKSPEEYGLVKSTEAAIKSAIEASEEVDQINKDFIEATKNVNLLASAREAINHKKKALENLVQLQLAGYYGDPKIPEEVRQEADTKTAENIRKRLKKRR